MRKVIICTTTAVISIFIFLSTASSTYNIDIFEKIRPSDNDLPAGFMYGKIPGFAQKVLKANPWTMDRPAITRLANKIYPGGESNRISAIHMTILANSRTPYGDDIVCYIILYNDVTSAKKEIPKLTEFTGYNSDRAIVVVRDNIAVFLHVDSADDFHYIKEMALKLEDKFKGI